MVRIGRTVLSQEPAELAINEPRFLELLFAGVVRDLADVRVDRLGGNVDAPVGVVAPA
jgi:hypothetical protein